MRNFKHIFVSLCLLSTLVYSEDVANIADNEKFKYLVNTKNIVETTCQYMVCPQVKEGYVTRVKDVNIKNGETQCYVYEKGSNKALGIVSNVNEQCMEDHFKLLNKQKSDISDSLKEFEAKKEQKSKLGYQNIKEQKDLYFNKYVDGGNQEYLDASKYIIAGLTLDNKIVNVSESINRNKVVLQEGYTVYPNSYRQGDKYEWYDDVAIFLGTDKEIEKRAKTDFALISETTTSLSSMTPELLSNVTVYIMHFMSEYNVQMLELKSFLLFTVVPFTLFFLLQSKLTKKMGEISDFDDAYERVFFTALTLFVFFFSTTTIRLDNVSYNSDDRKVSQTNYQNWFRNIFYEGSEIATGVARAGTTAYLRYKTQDLGAISSAHLTTLEIEYEMLKKERDMYLNDKGSGWLGECYKSFDTEKMKNDISSINNLGMRFPTSEILQNKDANGIINGNVNWYAEGLYLKEGANPNLSVSGCSNFERRYLTLKSRIIELKDDSDEKNIKGEIADYARASKDETINKQLDILVKTQFKNSAELGWIAFSMVPTINIAINELEIISSPTSEARKELTEANKEAQKNSLGIGSEDTSAKQAITNEMIEKLSNIAYMMLPAADSLYKLFKDLGQETLTILVNAVPLLAPILKFGIGGVAADAAIALLALMVTVTIMKFLLVIFPLIGIIMASVLAIAFYFFSVEIYYIISPFIIVFAMASQQGEVIKKFLKVGVTLAIKPIIIVISLVMAIWAYEFFKVFNDILVDWNFNSIFAVMRADGLQLFNTFFLTIAKQFIHIGLNIVAFVVVFYMVLNGANMIMDMFGISDANVDMQSSVGSNIDNKTSKWNGGGMG